MKAGSHRQNTAQVTSTSSIARTLASKTAYRGRMGQPRSVAQARISPPTISTPRASPVHHRAIIARYEPEAVVSLANGGPIRASSTGPATAPPTTNATRSFRRLSSGTPPAHRRTSHALSAGPAVLDRASPNAVSTISCNTK